MQNFNDPTFLKHVAIVFLFILISGAAFFQKQLIIFIGKSWQAFKQCFHTRSFDMEMDYNDYSQYLASIENPDAARLERINQGIEDFRKIWETEFSPEEVGKWVKKLYDIHPASALSKMEVDCHGMITEPA